MPTMASPRPRETLATTSGSSWKVVAFTIAAETVARAAVAIPKLATAPVLGIEVGLRPGRPRVRLEAEQTDSSTVIHDYGHDGTGVFWSWGCAADVVALCGLAQPE